MEDNTFKSLGALFKKVYSDEPIKAVKQPRERSRRFRRIGKKLKKEKTNNG